MSNDNDIVYRQEVAITRGQLEDFLEQINRDFDSDNELTVEEVLGNKKLLKYICSQVIDDVTDDFEELEFWNSDGWDEVEKYR